ncbi:unnamed protein product [Candidula unifasciata]|uniref:G-protein coupled receptors family 1 profile domain-containing protein n=1 Tax=Candidula unifasciata TaxID=100452 RepID=A0A8S3Z2A6_9EUPU|nr:unnamed protein product [Candidula unifasciata]
MTDTGYSTATVTAVPTSHIVIEKLLSDEASVIVQWVILAVTCQIINIFGTVTNIINILCFTKQGFRDPVNVSFLGLAISDLFCVASLLWTNVCMNPAFNEADLPFEPMEVQFITSGFLHTNFNRVTSCITAFITLERCLCITAPLKVRCLRYDLSVLHVLYQIMSLHLSFIYFSAGLLIREDLEFKLKGKFVS